MAYCLDGIYGSYDDGECSAGLLLQKLLEENYSKNRIVFVVRTYGGRKLGRDRFQLFKDSAKHALEMLK